MLTRLVWNRTVPTLIASLLLAVFAVLGFRVFSVLIGGGYADPASESARAQQIVHEEVGGEANLVVLVRAPEGEQAAESAVVGEEIAADLREHDGIESDHAFSDPGISDPLSQERGDGTEVLVGGSAPMTASNSQQVMKELGPAEGIAVFGAFFSTWIIAQLNDVSIFSINLITALGLGLAIDYSLLIVSRRQPAARSCSRGWQWPARCALCSCSPRRSCAPSASAAWPSSWRR